MDQTARLRARDRLRRRAALALSPEERLDRQAALTEELFALLRSNPPAWQQFLRRNFKKRAVRREADRPT